MLGGGPSSPGSNPSRPPRSLLCFSNLNLAHNFASSRAEKQTKSGQASSKLTVFNSNLHGQLPNRIQIWNFKILFEFEYSDFELWCVQIPCKNSRQIIFYEQISAQVPEKCQKPKRAGQLRDSYSTVPVAGPALQYPGVHSHGNQADCSDHLW